ncbi:acyl carrier protein, partial [Streptomyces sp. BE20]|uniref:acyl carrier protein n=1 Tax=Streptomyces sp. BE20 TaxID=3002525 RepID=UPI003FA69F1E
MVEGEGGREPQAGGRGETPAQDDGGGGAETDDLELAVARSPRLSGRSAADRQRDLLDLGLAETAQLASDRPDAIRPDGPFKDLGF